MRDFSFCSVPFYLARQETLYRSKRAEGGRKMSITFCPVGKYEEEDADVQMSNSNAYAIMGILGITPDCCGIIGTAELISKIDAVSANAIQQRVMEPAIYKSSGHATIINCGRSQEYVERKLSALRKLATENPGEISWG